MSTIHWNEQGQERSALWRSETSPDAPRRVVCVDDTISADTAYRLACEGTALLWRGDFQNARLLLQALARRLERKPGKTKAKAKIKAKAADHPDHPDHPDRSSLVQAFHLQRQAQSQRARVLAMLLIELQGDYRIALRRAPDWREPCTQAWGAAAGQVLVAPLRQLLGVVGAYEWRKNGVEIPALAERIHPHYGVFSPVRGEYVDLVAQAPLPLSPCEVAWDIGVGTGVLSAVLARRGVGRIIATDQDPRALVCAQSNLQRLGLAGRVQVVQADLFPPLERCPKAPLIVCNPPWLPARASSPLERAVYDEGSTMLRGYLAALAPRLTPQGQGWLILSDLAEHLGLRSRQELLDWIAHAGLRVVQRYDARPHHPKAGDASDPLHAARAAEVTSLWCLALAQ